MSLILLLILGIDWSTGYAIAGYCMTHGVSPFGYAFWQSFGPFSLLLVIQLIRRDLWLEKDGVVYALLCALTGIVIPNLLIYYAAVKIPSGLLTVVANTSPLFTCLLAWLLRSEQFALGKFLWVLIGLIGTAIVIVPAQQSFNLDLSSKWLYITLFIPISYAFSAVYIAKFHPGSGSVLNYSMWMLLFSTLFISPITMINKEYYELAFYDLNSGLILLEILLSTAGYLLLFIIIRKVGAVSYTLVNAIAVASGVIYGALLFGQQLSIMMYVAILLVIIAILGLSYGNKSKSEIRKKK